MENKTKNGKSKGLIYAIVVFVILNFLQFVYFQGSDSVSTMNNTITGHATADTSICINTPPEPINSCNLTIAWGIPYICQINTTDPDPGSVVTYSLNFLSGPPIFDIGSSSGTISYTGKKAQIGNYTIRVNFMDNSPCTNNLNFKDYSMSVIDVNHPPTVSGGIPDKNLPKSSSFAFHLNDYFSDMDGDNLTYFYMKSPDDNKTIIILDSTSLVTVHGTDCGESYFYFVAIDAKGLTVNSNIIHYTISGCPSTGITGSSSGAGEMPIRCNPSWSCSDWSRCDANGTSFSRCEDENICEKDNYIAIQTKPCTYVATDYFCQENWMCEEWSECINNAHTRSCVDENSCGTFVTKPKELETCAVSSCYNGVMDGNETGVDCGEPCRACRLSEQVTQIKSQINTSLIITLSLVAILSGIVIYGSRKRILKLYKSIIKLMQKSGKITYLNNDQKIKSLQLINIAQVRLDEGSRELAISSISNFMRQLLRQILNTDIINRNELLKNLSKLKNKNLEKILIDYYNRINILETQKLLVGTIELQSIIDESISILYLLVELNQNDALQLPKERTRMSKNSLESLYQDVSNTYIALEFNQILQAKKTYEEILLKYESLSIEQKYKIYPDIIRLFNQTTYLLGVNTK
jgi:hypothetical protein